MRSKADRPLLRPYSGSELTGLPIAAAETATLIAIAKDEGFYILEWIVYHLSIGFSKIIVIENESTDDTLEILEQIALVCPEVSVRRYRSFRLHESPQVSAYLEALHDSWSEWTMILDIDEFFVPYRDYSIERFLARIPEDVSSLHINWRGFGSSGRTSADYRFVLEAFTRCAPEHWSNHHHFKSIARTRLIEKVGIHDLQTSVGRRVLSDFRPFETVNNGQSDRIVYDGLQINHYQSKTYLEFVARMERGDANFHPEHARRRRDKSSERFSQIDVNQEENLAALDRRAHFIKSHLEISKKIHLSRESSQLSKQVLRA